MLKESVEVIETHGMDIKVKFTKRPMCSCCNFNTFCKSGEDTVAIANVPFRLRVGDKVDVGVSEKISAAGSVLLFGMPIIIFVAVILFLKKQPEIFGFCAALSAIAFYYAIVRILVKKREKLFNLTVLRKL